METRAEDNGGDAPPAGAVGSAGAVDTHCHPFLMEGEAEAVVAAARDAGVVRMISVGIDPATSARSLELAESFPGVFATAGVHPHTASGFDRSAGSAIEQLLASPLVVGVGETGLDHYRKLSPVEDQERAFRTHVALSRESGKPLVVHVRDAWEPAFAVLDDEGAERVVLHCFTGDETLALEAAARGWFLSFACNVTYPKADGIRAAAAAVPVDRLVLETDSPFLPPQSMRGQPNSPANVLAVAEAVARLRSLNVHEMVERSADAAMTAFPLIR